MVSLAGRAGVLLVLTDPEDACGPWVGLGLRARGLPAVWVTSPDLVRLSHLTHEVDDTGTRMRASVDSVRWSSASLVGVVNRLTYLPAVAGGSSDADYAQQEMNAVAVSWMHAVSEQVPCVGRPHPAGLGGAWRSPGEWMLLAGAARLETVSVRLGDAAPCPVRSGEVRVVVLLGQVFGPGRHPVPPEVSDGLRRLADTVQADALEVRMLPRDGWRVLGVTPYADLRLAGRAGLDHLARHLTGGRVREAVAS